MRRCRQLAVALLCAPVLAACTASPARTPLAVPEPSSSPAADLPSAPATRAAVAGIKSAPTVRLAETDEFGLVVRAIRSQGRVSVDVDRVDMLSGDEGEKAAAAAGQDYANDYFLVNNNPRTRRYVLAGAVHIWRVDNAHADTPRAVTVTQWLTYLHTPTERKPLFHFDVENGLVVGIEEQYRP